MTPAQSAWIATKLDVFALAFDLLMTKIEAGAFSGGPPAPDLRTADQRDWDEERAGTYR